MMTHEMMDSTTGEVAKVLVASHREFLAFVERRVRDRGLAEEIVQDALVRSLEHLGEIRESAIGWFYRVLRDALAAEIETLQPDQELQDVVCRCVGVLAATLKPEYADALRRIDVEGTSVKDYAEQAGISANNAGVRVFRARDTSQAGRLSRLYVRQPGCTLNQPQPRRYWGSSGRVSMGGASRLIAPIMPPRNS